MTDHDGWEQTTLGELVERSGGSIQTGPFGSQLHASDYVPEGVPSVMPANIGDNIINEDGIARITELDAERLARHRLRPGDIVYSRRGDVERRALVRTKNDGWLCGTGCLRVRFGDEFSIDSRFVSYLLGTPWAREWISQHAVGATMLNLNTAILSAVPLVVPSLLEQRAVADVLSVLDDKIEANHRLAAIAESLARSWYAVAVSDVPRNRMSEILEPRLGATPRRSNDDYWGGGHPWVSVKDVTAAASGLLLDTDESISELAISETRARPIPAGSVVLTARGTVGRVARLAVPASFNQSCYAFVPDGLSPGLLYFAVRDAAVSMSGLAHGSVFDTITTKTFEHVEIPDIRSVSREQAARIEAVHLAVENTARQNRLLATLRDTLLPKLMSGALKVREAQRFVAQAV